MLIVHFITKYLLERYFKNKSIFLIIGTYNVQKVCVKVYATYASCVRNFFLLIMAQKKFQNNLKSISIVNIRKFP